MSKTITFNPLAQLIEGVDILANAVKSTLGPKGNNVILQNQYQKPHVTKDGVTVAEAIEVEDPTQNLGVQIVREAAAKTAHLAGDGTTTSVVLAQAIIKEGYKLIQAGVPAIDIKRQLEALVPTITNFIKECSIPVADDYNKIKQVATISANNDVEIGELIAEAMQKATLDGVVAIKESKGNETYIEEVKGLQFNKGYASHYFMTDREKQVAEYEDVCILVTDEKIRDQSKLVPIIEDVYSKGKALLIIADEIEAQALQFCIFNKIRTGLKIVAVKAPAYGDRRKKILEDICIVTGATLISQDNLLRLQDINYSHLGSAKSITVTKDSTTVVDGNSDKQKLEDRIKEVRAEIENAPNSYEKETAQERLAKLIGGVAVLYVGAHTENELKEKKDRIDDALHATKAAMQEGIVAGGGLTLFNASIMVNGSDTYSIASKIMGEALQSPMKTIIENAGANYGEVKAKIPMKGGEVHSWGYNALTNTYEDLVSNGIVDPTMVTRVAVENAVSVANLILMTNCTIAQKDFQQYPEM